MIFLAVKSIFRLKKTEESLSQLHPSHQCSGPHQSSRTSKQSRFIYSHISALWIEEGPKKVLCAWTLVAQRLKLSSNNRKVAGSIPVNWNASLEFGSLIPIPWTLKPLLQVEILAKHLPIKKQDRVWPPPPPTYQGWFHIKNRFCVKLKRSHK